MQTVLSHMTSLPFDIPTVEKSSSSISLDDDKLTCEEYVALVTADVVKSMDAIAWARVNRKTRIPKLAQRLELLESGRPKIQRVGWTTKSTLPT